MARKTPIKQTPAGRAPTPPAADPAALDLGFLESLLGYNARRAALSVIGVFLQRMAPYGLRPVDFSVLSVIAHNPGVSSRQICAALDILPPNLVGLLKGLQKRGLIDRCAHPQDKRAHSLQLSAEGQRLYRRAQATASALEAESTTALSPDELQTLMVLLRKVYQR